MKALLHGSIQKLRRLSKLEYGESLVFNTSLISPEEKHTQVFVEEVIWQAIKDMGGCSSFNSSFVELFRI